MEEPPLPKQALARIKAAELEASADFLNGLAAFWRGIGMSTKHQTDIDVYRLITKSLRSRDKRAVPNPQALCRLRWMPSIAKSIERNKPMEDKMRDPRVRTTMENGMTDIVIRQPWAWLIVHGFKGIENRSWMTRYRRTLLIQASASPPAKCRLEAIRLFARKRAIELPESRISSSIGLLGSIDFAIDGDSAQTAKGLRIRDCPFVARSKAFRDQPVDIDVSLVFGS